ncbi:MAG: flagellar basal body rod protein FlgC [Halocynthiibacter sp.]
MNDFSSALSISASGMRAQAQRLRYTSENIANIDTPGYQRKTFSLSPEVVEGQRTGGVSTGDVQLDKTALPKVFDPSHPLANADGYYMGSNVNTLIEIADAREAQRSYEANLKMFDQARQMSTAALDLLRR